MSVKVIHLTDRAPIEIDTDTWTLIARAKGHDGKYESQAFRNWWIAVRRHPNLGTVVYGAYSTAWQGEHNCNAGVFLDAREADPAEHEVIEFIRAVAEELGIPEFASEVIQDLPAESLIAS